MKFLRKSALTFRTPYMPTLPIGNNFLKNIDLLLKIPDSVDFLNNIFNLKIYRLVHHKTFSETHYKNVYLNGYLSKRRTMVDFVFAITSVVQSTHTAGRTSYLLCIYSHFCARSHSYAHINIVYALKFMRFPFVRRFVLLEFSDFLSCTFCVLVILNMCLGAHFCCVLFALLGLLRN